MLSFLHYLLFSIIILLLKQKPFTLDLVNHGRFLFLINKGLLVANLKNLVSLSVFICSKSFRSFVLLLIPSMMLVSRSAIKATNPTWFFIICQIPENYGLPLKKTAQLWISVFNSGLLTKTHKNTHVTCLLMSSSLFSNFRQYPHIKLFLYSPLTDPPYSKRAR